MHVPKERYVKKCGKDICGLELYTLVVSFRAKNVDKYRAVVILLLLVMSVKMAPYWGKGGILIIVIVISS